jgi:hypothetical protein
MSLHRAPQSAPHPAPQSTATTRPLAERTPVPPRVKLAAAWTSFMFLYVYVDVLNFYKPGSSPASSTDSSGGSRSALHSSRACSPR